MSGCRWIVGAAVVLLAGCQLAEVVTVGGADLPVVDAVLEAGADEQRILLHRTLGGGAPDGGAVVTVRSAGGSHVFTPLPPDACVRPSDRADREVPPVACFGYGGRFVQPGEIYELEVTSGRGERLHGTTTVPGEFRYRVPEVDAAPGEPRRCALRPGRAPEIVWSRSEGAWSYLGRLELEGIQEAYPELDLEIEPTLRLTGLSVSASDTTMVLPADFGLLERADLPPAFLLALREGFRAGVTMRMTVAAVDANYVNAVRGGAFNPSGNVRVPSVFGDGTGVFGSSVPLRLDIEVREHGGAADLLCEG